ncbi:MAG: hypothetical protein OSB34_10855, partial [Planktomarina sp.]|nr:hypothetical protein [Planktomarina sp.]
EILSRRSLIKKNFPGLAAKGWELLGLGAYFAYLKHPFNISSNTLAKHLVSNASILTLPGTMFVTDTDRSGEGQLRIAFANIDAHRINLLFDRLEKVIL